METAFTPPHFFPISKSPKPNPNLPSLNPPNPSPSSKQLHFSPFNGVSSSVSSTSSSSTSSSVSSRFRDWNHVSSSSLFHNRTRRRRTEICAKSPSAPERGEDVEGEGEEGTQSNKLIKNVELGILILAWYLLTTLFNIYNKQVLVNYPFPLTISALHFGIGTILVLLMWTFKLHKKPKISMSQLAAILPLAIAHTLGNLFTNMSLGKVSVSFTHTIKAMEPFFSVVLSALFLGEMPTFWMVSSLVPVVGGVALASFTEASFDWIGFWSAMASNLTNQSRNVLSKKLLIKKEEEYLDNITLFSIITIMSFILTIPATLFMEGVKFSPAYLQSAGLNFNDVCARSILAGLLYHSYQQVAYVILERVSPVTHSVSNCVKRIVIIVTSVLFFRTPVSVINCVGTGVAIAGVFLYSRLKQLKPKLKKHPL